MHCSRRHVTHERVRIEHALIQLLGTEIETPPSYFSPEASARATDFERRLRAGERVEPLAGFPFAAPPAQIYRNWLEYIARQKFAT